MRIHTEITFSLTAPVSLICLDAFRIRIFEQNFNVLAGVEEGACRVVKNIGKPDAGKLHVRFDEGWQGKTCSLLYHRSQAG